MMRRSNANPTMRYHCLLLGFVSLSTLPATRAQILTDRPLPIDQLVQIVWDPSALIYMWTALDQFYNIALGWHRAARSMVSLPFRDGRSMDHVRIQQPKKYYLRHKQLDAPHWERFNRIYSAQQPVAGSSVQLPAVMHQNSLPLPAAHHQNSLLLPPPFLFHPQQQTLSATWPQNPALADRQDDKLRALKHLLQTKVFAGKGGVKPQDMFGSTVHGWPLSNRDDDRVKNVRHPLETKVPMDKSVQVGVKPANPAGVESGPVPMLFFNSNGAQNSNPEARLRMFLKLMKQLGEMHTAHKTKFDDSKENGLNR